MQASICAQSLTHTIANQRLNDDVGFLENNEWPKELTDLIENEIEHDKVTTLIAELDSLQHQEKKPVSKSPAE